MTKLTKIIIENEDDFKLKEDDEFYLKDNPEYFTDNVACRYRVLMNGGWYASIDDKGNGWTTSPTRHRDITLKEDGTLIIGKLLKKRMVIHEYINCDPARYDYMPEEEFTKIRGNSVYAKAGNSYIDRALPF